MSLSQDAYILIWTEQVSCLCVKPASASLMAEKSPGFQRRPGGSTSQAGFGGRGNGGVQSEALQASRFSVGAEQGAQRRPPGRAKGLCSRGGGPGLPSSASGGGRGARGARSRATARPGRRSRKRAKRRRRRRRLPLAPASFSRAARTRWPPPAGAGSRTPDPVRAAHVPVRRWRGVRVAGSSPGGAPGLLMPRAGARREDLREAAGREREKERVRARRAAPGRGRGRRAPDRTAPPHPPRRCTPRCAPGGAPSPRNFSTWPVRGRGRGRCPASRGSPTPSLPQPRSPSPAYQRRRRPRQWGAHPAARRAVRTGWGGW